MIKKFLVPVGLAILMSACAQPEPPPPPPPSGAATNAYMIFFDLDRANVTPQAAATLAQAAGAYKSSGASAMTVTGHADRSGPDAYNMALSLHRANAARDVLAREGVPASAIAVVGRGESQPLVATADGVVEPQNRRDEIVIGMGGNDLAYCKELSRLYRRYLGNRQSDAAAGEALAQCDAGNPGPASPVLERYLTDAKINLPPRT